MGTYQDILREQNFIAGAWSSLSEGSLEVKDKYSGELLGTLPLAPQAGMEAAILGAEAARKPLWALGAGGRSEKLKRLADLLEERQEAFVDLIVREAGKPLGYAQGELSRCLVTLRTAAAESLRFGGEYVPIDYGKGKGRTAFTKRFPVGLIGAITPFNFPLNLALHKIAPALAVGCPIITKPSPFTPLVLLAFAALVEEVGFPAGSVSVLVADIPVAETLVKDERIALLSFTGSDSVGWKLKALAGKKKVLLELGGNAATVVDDSADLAFTAQRVAIGSYLYAGQICISTQRIYVVESVLEEFQKLLLAEIAQLKVGDPQDPAVSVGPLIGPEHVDRIGGWVEESVAGGAQVLTGGEVVSAEHCLYAPTLLSGVTPEMKLHHREAFGPVATLTGVADFTEALDAVNNSPFGLQAGIFTNRIDHLRLAHETLEVGGILINDIPGFRVDSMPYGGIKDSGLGREGLKYAMEEMTEPRLLIY